jgi:multidrug efflux pump subunit AcrB
LLYPFARLGLLSWLLALVVFPIGCARLSKARRPEWWAGAWTYTASAGIMLAVIAILSYGLPREVSASNSMGYAYVKVPFINWQKIPIAIGYLVLAAAMWWILTAPGRPAARPGERL